MKSCKQYRSFFMTLNDYLTKINSKEHLKIFEEGLKFISNGINVSSISCIVDAADEIYLRCGCKGDDFHKLDDCLSNNAIKHIDYLDSYQIYISLESLCEFFDKIYAQEMINSVIVEEEEKSREELALKIMELEARINKLENNM